MPSGSSSRQDLGLVTQLIAQVRFVRQRMGKLLAIPLDPAFVLRLAPGVADEILGRLDSLPTPSDVLLVPAPPSCLVGLDVPVLKPEAKGARNSFRHRHGQ